MPDLFLFDDHFLLLYPTSAFPSTALSPFLSSFSPAAFSRIRQNSSSSRTYLPVFSFLRIGCRRCACRLEFELRTLTGVVTFSLHLCKIRWEIRTAIRVPGSSSTSPQWWVSNICRFAEMFSLSNRCRDLKNFPLFSLNRFQQKSARTVFCRNLFHVKMRIFPNFDREF